MSLEIDARRVALHLEEHITKPVAFAPAPIALAIVGVFRRNVLEEIAGVKAVGGLQADQRLVARAGFDVALRLAA